MTRTVHAFNAAARAARSRTVVELRDVVRRYGDGDNAVTALDHLTLGLPAASFTAVMGPSGSGKSTLLQCAAGLDRPTTGSITLDGVDLAELDETALTRLRRDRIGFVFQAFNLVPTLTVEQNVTLPRDLAGRHTDRAQVHELLARLGLAQRRTHRPAQLSGGQQQRVAIARALLSRPAVVFADEPTGALDTTAAHEVLNLLRGAVHGYGQTVVMVTHDPVAASYADGVVFVADGRLAGTMARPSADAVAAHLAQLGTGGAR
jgi:putative ABC transport system ATP-binding protein